MAVDKGKQFEYAIMIAAYSRLAPPLTREIQNAFDDIMKKTNNSSVISDDVKKAANLMIDKIQPYGDRERFYKSFKQLGGGIGGGGEPKTDVLFIKGGVKYKCSMKWGDKYQLSSSGISKTSEVLTKVLKLVSTSSGLSKSTTEDIALFITELENSLGSLPKKGEQSIMKSALDANQHLKIKFEQILGSRKSPLVADAYKLFKDKVVEESLTGKLLFGKDNDKSANYILNEKELKPIDNTLVKSISDKTYVRLRLKGRGKTSYGVRLNELVVTIEPK